MQDRFDHCLQEEYQSGQYFKRKYDVDSFIPASVVETSPFPKRVKALLQNGASAAAGYVQ